MEQGFRTERIPMKTKFGYSMGTMGDVIAFNFFYAYFIYYLTDFAGLPPVMAGIISMITVWFDAITDPIIGGLSDRSKNPKGRRGPFLIYGAILEYITLILMYTVMPIDSVAFKVVWYLIIGCSFWLGYTLFVIPFLALGAELTQDYEERNALSTFRGIFIYVASWFGTAGPMVVIAFVERAGIGEKWAWTIGAVVFGAIALIGAIICRVTINGKELIAGESNMKRESIGRILISYFGMLRYRAYRFYIYMVFVFCIAYTMEQGSLVYLMGNKLGLSAGLQSSYWTFFAVFSIVLLPLINRVCNKYGKLKGSAFFYLVATLGMFICYFTQIPNYTILIVHCFCFCIANSVYWTIGYSMMFDTAEVMEFKNGTRDEGKVTGMGSFAQKLASSFGAWGLGMLLAFFHYDANAAVQAPETMSGFVKIAALFPGILLILTAVICIFNPLSREKFNLLMEKLAKKRAGEEVTDEGIENLF